MQFGSLAKSLTVLSLVAALSYALSAQPLMAQFPDQNAGYQGSAGPAQQQAGPMQALFMSSGRRMFGAQQTPYVDANGNPVIVPAGYCQQCPGGCPGGYGGPMPCDPAPGGDCYGGPMHSGGFTGPYPMGAGGTDPAVGYDLMEDVGMEGFLVDQRGPHYFDARAEAVYMTPDETFGRDIPMTSLNVTDDNIVLRTGQLDYDFETGFRVVGRFDICPLSVLEFGYMGIYDWESNASFTDPNPVDPVTGTGNLFSLFSEFGTNPNTVAVPGGPMPETERSITQSISINSSLQSAEMTYRRYWVGFVPRVSGTWLAGFRYTKLKEDFYFSTSGEAAQVYADRADNDLAGFQTGGDVWIGLMQGLRIGAEGKVGLFNNHYTLYNTITTTPLGTTPPTLNERFAKDQPALITEASVDLVADVLPSWSVRGGYEILYLNSVVLAGDNFNTASPYGLPNQTPRIPFVADQGQNFYHGGTPRLGIYLVVVES